MVPGEFTEIVNEVGLIVVSALIGYLRHVQLLIAVFSQGALKADDAGVYFGGETAELLELPFKLPCGKTYLRCQRSNVHLSFRLDDMPYGNVGRRFILPAFMQLRDEKTADDLHPPVVAGGRHHLFL